MQRKLTYNTDNMHRFGLLVILTLGSSYLTATSAFQVPSSSYVKHHTLARQKQQSTHRCSTLLHQSEEYDEEAENDDEEYDLVEFFVSPEQITLLRKEASKRERRNKLTKFFLPAEESIEVSQETLDEISALFDTSELVEVRGVSTEKKKYVFDTATALAEVLEEEIGKPVVVVEVKGFAAKLYCPFDDDNEDPQRIILRSSYKPNQWTKKAKPVRDARGQIIKGEDGKSIKEIPE